MRFIRNKLVLFILGLFVVLSGSLAWSSSEVQAAPPDRINFTANLDWKNVTGAKPDITMSVFGIEDDGTLTPLPGTEVTLSGASNPSSYTWNNIDFWTDDTHQEIKYHLTVGIRMSNLPDASHYFTDVHDFIYRDRTNSDIK